MFLAYQKADGIKRRQNMVAFAEKYIREHGYAPTLAEVAAALSANENTIRHHMRQLMRIGDVVGNPLAGRAGSRAWTLPKFAAAIRAAE